MYAIVNTGSKQYRVSEGDFINIEKIAGEAGDKVELDTIFVSDNGKIVSDPAKAAATKVVAEIVEQFKDKKVIVFKFKKRKNYQRKVGHRQQLTRVKIVSIGA
ncbi:50S ribosomal protein L21 [Phoenicibacter congonensis]|uniref:50S ribosomal protein L21 n=1 Tax=Phoenicibacter congonensis TaxID=1944646 RepID=UPI0009A59351|nr:50S ribosomal protein L21 [Phoenicibacter congonensis]